MLKHLLTSTLYFCISQCIYSQDYSLYYKYIDSIHYYKVQQNENKVFELYKITNENGVKGVKAVDCGEQTTIK